MPLTTQSAEGHRPVTGDVGTYEWWPFEDRLTWSPGLIQMYGTTKGPLSESGFLQLVHPEDRIRVGAETLAYLSSESASYSRSFRIIRPDGNVRFILDRGTIERNEIGAARIIRGVHVDLTDFAYLDRQAMVVQRNLRAGAEAIPGGPARVVSDRDFSWLAESGEMGERIRTFDWSTTPLGPLQTWSPALRMMTRTLLTNRFPLLLWWGPQYVSIYNDAYRPVLGTKHPWALGQPVSTCWKEVWPILQPLIDTPFHGGPATWNDDILLEINRHGFTEETHFTIAYSPVPDETTATGIGGVLATVHEITDKIVGERRLVALRDLGAAAPEARSAEEACRLATRTLTSHDKDIPFALLYLIDADGKRARLTGSAGLATEGRACPAILDLGGGEAPPWPIAEVVGTQTTAVVGDLAGRFGPAVPPGPWSDPPREAVVVPIKSNVAHRLAGVLVAGVSARLKLDDLYLSFYALVAGQIGAAVANARAYEEERERAEDLVEIDRVKTQFFSNVSHEFRTPLTLMLGPIEDLLRSRFGKLSTANRGHLEIVHRNSLRLLKLVNTMLDFSRIEAGRMQANYEETDLAAYTAELASNFRSACERAGLSLTIVCSPSPPDAAPAYVDRDMWEKIVLNLLSNAFKFTLHGGIDVRLTAAGATAELAVHDTGVGIPADELPHLFERFHRVTETRGRSFEGTGIGLAMVRELAWLHGGSVRVVSDLGRGSTFTVSIPLGRAHLDPAHIRKPSEPSPVGTGAQAFVEEAFRWLPTTAIAEDDGVGLEALKASERGLRRGERDGAEPPRPRILWADDNADMRDYVNRMLSGSFEVEATADGVSALEKARAMQKEGRAPDLVLSDVMMPRLDGFGLVRALRTDPALNAIPIILLSARAGEEARIEGVDSGADDYLVKPFSARELLAKVQSQVKMAGVRRDAIHAVHESEERLRFIADRAEVGYWHWNIATDRLDWSPLCKQLFGVPLDDPISYTRFLAALHPDDRERTDRAVRACLESHGQTDYDIEYRTLWPSGTVRWIQAKGNAVFADGNPVRMAGIALDITGRKQAEEREQLLTREINHRSKNMLSLIQAIARQTASTSSGDFIQRFDKRLQSLAATQDLLIEHAWKAVPLTDLVSSQLAYFTDLIGERLKISGPPLLITSSAAEALSMAVHELATNAAKYGALSTDSGRITIGWKVDSEAGAEPQFSLSWVEEGGPPVNKPERRGFGSIVTLSMVEVSLDGEVSVDYARSGLVWQLSCSASKIVELT